MSESATPVAGPLVLLVDDDPTQLDLTRMLLSHAGFTVVPALGARQALDIAHRRRPDAIVSDVVMGDLDGFSLCSLFRGDPALEGVPVVLVSAHFTGEEDRTLAECAGASALVERTPMLEAELTALRRALADAATAPPAPQRRRSDEYASRMAIQMAKFLARTRDVEARYHTLLDHANEAIAVVTPEGEVRDVNPYWERIRQLPREQLIGQNVRDFAAPGHEDSNLERYRRSATTGVARSPIVPIARADGSTVYMEFSATPVDIDGERLVITMGRDVTETVAATRQLEASERKYRSLVENVPDVVWLGTLEGKVTFLSPRVEAVCGFTPGDIAASADSFWFDRIHPDDVDRVRAAYAAIANGGYRAEFRWRHKDGQWVWIRSRGILTTDADGKPLVEGTFGDVTDQKRLEDQVRQSQKMEALGQLTGAIAHDFNNLLAIILGNGRMLLDALDEGDDRREDAQGVLDAAERAASLIRQLLMFSRHQIVRPASLSLNTLIGGIEKMLQHVVREDIQVRITLSPDLGSVLADPGEMEQVLLNLVVNASDAMSGGGTLSIETMNVELGADYATAHNGVVPGPYVLLSVTDTGCGMDEETKRRAFEPFFTTKGEERGTGLGLSTCYGIVQRCQGHIAIYTEVDRGTVFKVYLPRVSAGPLPDDGPGPVAYPEHNGTETILLVEDDDDLRQTMHRILTLRGYHVLDAGDGREAEIACDRHAGPIHLLLTDMVMPGLSGPDTVGRILGTRPDTKVMFMSGYSDHALLQSGSIQAKANFIQKPFTPQALALKVREVLND